MKARQADRLSSESEARMAAGEHFITSLVHKVDAVLLTTNCSESWLCVWRGLLDDIIAVSATLGLLERSELFASFTHMIRSFRAASTEVGFTLRASDSVFSHVDTSFLSHFITLIIFSV